ncbi:hypothetical protein [Flavobacterium cyanobacteriorum]|uniref:hypothetical protein n=1 Tax=Flavobacterium cyanobacteriorum TaxID=2022802 RepID=UPI00101ADCE0|nr:hypothetical protein [Flavobacterium cyanobacteriorum]
MALFIFGLFISCKSAFPFDIDKNTIAEPKKSRKVSFFKNTETIASKNIRKGIIYIPNDSTKGRKLESIIFRLSESSIYDLNKGKLITFKNSIHKSFQIALYELDSLHQTTTKKIVDEDIEVIVNYKKDIAIVDLIKYDFEIPKFGMFIEFATNLPKDLNEINYENYPSIRVIKTTNYNDFIPMKLQLYRKENAYWEIEPFLMKSQFNYDIKIILEK